MGQEETRELGEYTDQQKILFTNCEHFSLTIKCNLLCHINKEKTNDFCLFPLHNTTLCWFFSSFSKLGGKGTYV